MMKSRTEQGPTHSSSSL
uniref:Uncharacterized protein n=1 Tax=Arundo donax TaxID=35708 RepID=A0A0A9AGK3_ARUDO